MRCPKCDDARLQRTNAAFTCPSCHGVWLRKDDDVAPPIANDTEAGETSNEAKSATSNADSRTGPCPEGHGIMLRARAGEPLDFSIERCPHCRGIWLDEGEWERIVRHELDLHSLFDPKMRAKRRAEAVQSRVDDALRDELGDAEFARLRACVETLREHPAKAQALAWITAQLNR